MSYDAGIHNSILIIYPYHIVKVSKFLSSIIDNFSYFQISIVLGDMISLFKIIVS